MSIPHTAQAYIFDFDGTLVKSLDVWKKADDLFLERRGLSYPENFYQMISHMNLPQASEYIRVELSLPETALEIEREFVEIMHYQYANEIELLPGAGEYLVMLKEQGARLAIATSNQEELFVPCLENNGVLSLFDAYATTAEAGCTKGEPGVYLLAAKKLSAKPEDCEVFEDILPGIAAAKSVGMKCTGILEERSRPDWDKIKALSDRVITDYRELLR